MDGWLSAVVELEKRAEPCVLVTVVTARGSTPREAGCKMVVTREARYDTIGGGNLEFVCIKAAREMLHGAARPTLRDFPLGPELGQCCGGHVSVLFEPLRPALSQVVVFGAGHVGRALVSLLGGLPVRVRWIDTRPEEFPDTTPSNTEMRVATDPANEVLSLAAGSIVLVMTHDHQIDFNIVTAALPRADFAAVGLIGSVTKRARFVRRLARLGLTQEAIGRLICPIGVPGADGKLPAEIAIAVAAQILQIKGNAMQDRPSDTGCGECAGECASLAVRA